MKILFLAYNPTSLNGILIILEELKKKLCFTPILLCSGCYYETDEYEVINTENKEFNNKSLGTQKKNLSTWYNKKNRLLYYQVRLFLKSYIEMSRLDKKAKNIYESVKPDYFIVTDDRVGGIHMAMLKYAKEGTVIRVPVAVQTDYNASFSNREYDCALVVKDNPFDLNHFQRRLGQKMIHSIGDRKRVFYQSGQALAFFLLGMLPRYPWVSGASKCDYVFTVSKVEKDLIVEQANPRCKQVKVTGLPEDYKLAFGVQNTFDVRKKYNGLGKKIVVFAIPQLAEHNEVPWNIHKENIETLCRWISDKYGKILFSLHPKSKREDYYYLEKKGWGYICDEKLSDIIRFSDVLICSENSSVKEWSTLLGIKRYVTLDNELKSRISDVSKVIVLEEVERNIHYREKEDIKNIAAEITKVICCS